MPQQVFVAAGIGLIYIAPPCVAVAGTARTFLGQQLGFREESTMREIRNSASRRSSGKLRWLGAPSLLTGALAVAAACSSEQGDESIELAQQAAAATGVLLNEVVFDPRGQGAADAAHQYIEIMGSANGTLEGYQLVVVDGRSDGGLPGVVLGAVDLGTACAGAACAIGSNGMLVVTPEATGGRSFPAETTRVALGYTMDNNTGLGTDDFSILLIQSDTPITTSADLDSADDGTLELPTGATLVDAVGWRESTTGLIYGGVDVKPNTAAQDSPDAMIRIAGNTTPLTVNAWFYAEITGNDGSSATLDEIATAGTGTIPSDLTVLTPGLPNTLAAPNNGTAGAAGMSGVAGAAGSTGSVSDGGTAGATDSGVAGASGAGEDPGMAGTAGTAGSAGQIIIVIPAETGGAPAETGGAPSTGGFTAVAGAAAETGGSASVAGAPGTGTGGVTSAAGASPTENGGTAGAATLPAETGGVAAAGAPPAETGGVPGAAGTPAIDTAGAAGTPVIGSGGGAQAGNPSVAGSSANGGAGTGGATTTTGQGGSTLSTGVGGGATASGGATTASSTGGTKASTTATAKVGGATSSSTTSAGDGEGDDDEGSCGCRVVGKQKSPISGLAVFAAMLGAMLSRRRRRQG